MKSVRSPVGSLLRPIAFDPWRVGYGRARRLLGIVVQPLSIRAFKQESTKSTMHEQRPAWTPAEISAGISVAYCQRHYIKIFKVRGRRRPAGSPGSPGGSETRVRERERERECVLTQWGATLVIQNKRERQKTDVNCVASRVVARKPNHRI